MLVAHSGRRDRPAIPILEAGRSRDFVHRRKYIQCGRSALIHRCSGLPSRTLCRSDQPGDRLGEARGGERGQDRLDSTGDGADREQGDD